MRLMDYNETGSFILEEGLSHMEYETQLLILFITIMKNYRIASEVADNEKSPNLGRNVSDSASKLESILI